jgi:hypothetical protein
MAIEQPPTLHDITPAIVNILMKHGTGKDSIQYPVKSQIQSSTRKANQVSL